MIKVNELYYPVEANIDFNIGVSGAFRYDLFDRYGDRKGESDWLKNTIQTAPRDALKAAIAQQAIGYETAWGHSPNRITIQNGANGTPDVGPNDSGSFSGPVQSAKTVTWTVTGLVCQNCLGSSYTPRIKLESQAAGVTTLIASTDTGFIADSEPFDTFDLTYTFSFTYNQWNDNAPFLKNVCDGNTTSVSSNGAGASQHTPWIGRAGESCLLTAYTGEITETDSKFKVYGKTGNTTLTGHTPAGAKAESYNRFGIGDNTVPWFYNESILPFTGLDNKRVKVQVTWTVG